MKTYETPSVKQFNKISKIAKISIKNLDDIKLIREDGEIIGFCNRKGDKQYFINYSI